MGGYVRCFFETLGPIALNYFFAASAYKYCVSTKPTHEKLVKRLTTLIVPYITWNTIYISLYTLENGFPNIKAIILGYTLSPFDGPLWYIFVLYILLLLYSACARQMPRLFENLKLIIIILAFLAAAFHYVVTSSLIHFPYDWWIERTLRMIPPFLYGVYCSTSNTDRKNETNSVMSCLILVICLLITIIFDNSFFATLLLYAFAQQLWRTIPNITLKDKSLMRNDVFIVYSLHEAIIIVMVALLNRGNVFFENSFSIFFAILLITLLIVNLGFILNLFIGKFPTIVNVMLTGGRNKPSMERRYRHDI